MIFTNIKKYKLKKFPIVKLNFLHLKMKHTLKVTVVLALFFFIAQFTGLLVVNHYIDHKKTSERKSIVLKPLPYGLERPQVENQSTSFIYITAMILTGTLLFLLLIRLNKPVIFKVWFFIGVWFALSIACAAFINDSIPYVKFVNEKFVFFTGKIWFLSLFSFIDNFAAMLIAFTLSIFKLYKPNVIIQNISEIFIYGGLAAFVVNIFNFFAVVMLLVVISVYDYISVFKTKHMIKLAKFQSESKIFAGLLIPYEKGKILLNDNKTKISESKSSGHSSSSRSVAILGGGDIGFTLIFAGVVMKDLMIQEVELFAFLKTLIIPFFVTLSLLFLLSKGRKNKFYPAMPVLSLGCFIGYLVVLMV